MSPSGEQVAVGASLSASRGDGVKQQTARALLRLRGCYVTQRFKELLEHVKQLKHPVVFAFSHTSLSARPEITHTHDLR